MLFECLFRKYVLRALLPSALVLQAAASGIGNGGGKKGGSKKGGGKGKGKKKR